MAESLSFLDFCKSIIETDIDDVDVEAVLSFYNCYIEPYCERNNIELPIEFIEYMTMLYDLVEGSSEDDDD